MNLMESLLANKLAAKSSSGGSDLTPAVKTALLDCFANVAWATEDGQQYYDALADALYGLQSISAVYTQSGTVYDTDSLDSLKADLVVTALYGDGSTQTVPAESYTLSGTLTEGTSTITVSYGGKTATFDVVVSVGWRYVPSMGKLSKQRFIDNYSQGTLTQLTETVTAGLLRLYYTNAQSGKNQMFKFVPTAFTEKAYFKIVFKMVGTNSASASASNLGYFTFRTSDGESGAFVGFVRPDGDTVPQIRWRVGGSGISTGSSASFDDFHTIEVLCENGKQTIKLDGTVEASSVNPSTYYTTNNAIVIQGVSNSTFDVYIQEIEYHE